MIQTHTDYFLNDYKTMEGRFDLFEAFMERPNKFCRNHDPGYQPERIEGE